MDYETVDLIVGKPGVCDMCYGKGSLYYGNEEDYSVEPCECTQKKEGNKVSTLMSIRPIRDPYDGRGFELKLNLGKRYAISMVPYLGVSESLLHLEVMATPPFDAHAVNEGHEPMPQWFRRLGVKVGALFVTFGLEFYIYN